MLAELLETAMQVADVRDRIDNFLAVERQHQPQRRVRRGMLRAEVERPQVFLFGVIRRRCFGEGKGHVGG